MYFRSSEPTSRTSCYCRFFRMKTPAPSFWSKWRTRQVVLWLPVGFGSGNENTACHRQVSLLSSNCLYELLSLLLQQCSNQKTSKSMGECLAVGKWTGFRNLRAKKHDEAKKSLSFRENIFSPASMTQDSASA